MQATDIQDLRKEIEKLQASLAEGGVEDILAKNKALGETVKSLWAKVEDHKSEAQRQSANAMELQGALRAAEDAKKQNDGERQRLQDSMKELHDRFTSKEKQLAEAKESLRDMQDLRERLETSEKRAAATQEFLHIAETAESDASEAHDREIEAYERKLNLLQEELDQSISSLKQQTRGSTSSKVSQLQWKVLTTRGAKGRKLILLNCNRCSRRQRPELTAFLF